MKLERKSYKKIARISPSQFHSIKNCGYKLVLSCAYDNQVLLPVSPYAYMGTVIHRILEKIMKGLVKNESEFDLTFKDEIQTMEQFLINNGMGYYVPLQINVRDFGMKKILLKRRINVNKTVYINTVRYFSEKWHETKNGILGGRIDLITIHDSNIEIVDFKTGEVKKNILDDDNEVPEIKDEYKDQIKLYAFLYYDTEMKYPTKLSIVNLQNQKFNINFTETECEGLFNEVKELIKEINSSIELNSFSRIARPSNDNCKRCLYRPACSFYLEYLLQGNFLFDITGEISNITRYLNGSVAIEIIYNGQVYDITGFNEDNYEYLKSKKNEIVFLYNLFKTINNSYKVTKTTTIYE